MCIIVDTNVAGLIFGGHTSIPMAAEFLRGRIYSGKLNPVFSNALFSELESYAFFRGWLTRMRQTGAIGELDDHELEQVESIASDLRKQAKIESNDHGIIALAQVAKAKVLCTNDVALQQDYINLKIGVVYPLNSNKPKRHRQLLDNYGNCPRLKSKRG